MPEYPSATFMELGPAHTLAPMASALCAAEFSKPLQWDMGGRVYAAVEGGDVLGVANVIVGDLPDTAYLRYLAVDPDCRNRGIGSTMMQGVIAAAKAEGCKTLELIPYPQKGGEEAKARLVAFYERHRFKGEEKSPYMSLSLVGPPAGRAQPAL